MQTEFFLPISGRTVLVPVNAARMCLGVTAEAIISRIESGQLLWVWDIGAHTEAEPVNQYRLWARELLAPSALADIAQVLPFVLGQRAERFTRSQVSLILCSSRPTVKALVDLGDLQEINGFIPRASLEAFLRHRWVGRAKPQSRKEDGNLGALAPLRELC